MPISPGWGYRNGTGSNGTTSLSLTMPLLTVENDIMLMWLVHKGTGYATVPGGWTLIQRGLSGSTRGELYWKRAGAAEAGPYSITGLADTARGFIAVYSGGLLSGDIVNVSGVAQNASGTRTGPSITSSVRNTLLVAGMCVGANIDPGILGTSVNSWVATPDEVDGTLTSMAERSGVGTTNGTDCFLEVCDACKAQQSATGPFTTQSAVAAENVYLVACLVAETSQLTTGSRYYLTGFGTVTPIWEHQQGDWQSSAWDPDITPYLAQTMLLSQNKLDCRKLYVLDQLSNQQGDYARIMHRLYTPPLAAQTIGGTINFCFAQIFSWVVGISGGTAFDTDAAFEIFVYISQGQTGLVRHVLLEQTQGPILPRDPTGFVIGEEFGATGLTSADCLEGDSVVIEYGINIVASPTPEPTYPPTEFSQLIVRSAGATTGGNNSTAGIGVPDQFQDESAIGTCSWFDFSQTLIEAAPPDAPENISSLTAEVIGPTLPVDIGPVNVSQSPQNLCAVWYEWTAPASGPVNLNLLGTNYDVAFRVFTGDLADLTGVSVLQESSGYSLYGRSLSYGYFTAVADTTYYIRIAASHVPSRAGLLRFTLDWRDDVPQTDDIFFANRNIFCYRKVAGVWRMVNFGWSGALPVGCCIDYSRTPLWTYVGDGEYELKEVERIYTSIFGFTTLVELHGIQTLGRQDSDEPGYFYSYMGVSSADDAENAACLDINPNTEKLTIGHWGNGFLHVNGGGTGSGDLTAYMDSPSDDSELDKVIRMSAFGTADEEPYEHPVESHVGLAAATEAWNVTTDPSGRYLYYTSDGDYIPPRSGATFTIRKYDLDTSTPLGIVATVPPAPAVEPGCGLRGLALHPDGHLFVCNGDRVQMLSPAGVVVQDYLPVGDTPYDGEQMQDVKVSADGLRIYAIDEGYTIYEWEIESATQLSFGHTWHSVDGRQIAIYRVATITIVKAPLAETPTTIPTFTFTMSPAEDFDPPVFTLQPGESMTFEGVTPGSGYGVSEGALDNWGLDSTVVSNGSASVNLTVAPGEAVVVTFTNSPRVCECCLSTQLQITNHALAKLGQTRFITDLDEATAEGYTAAQLWDLALRAALRHWDWPFATKYAGGTAAVDGYMNLIDGSPSDWVVENEWTYAYRYPLDCLKARRLVKDGGAGRAFDPTPIPFRVGRTWNGVNDVPLIYTNEPDAVLEYTALVECSEEFFDALFEDALSWRLAGLMAPGLTRTAKTATECMSLFMAVLDMAKAVAAQEAQQDPHGQASWTRDRA